MHHEQQKKVIPGEVSGMRKLLQNTKGSTLTIVLTVLVVVIIFSVTALTIGSASIKQAGNQELRLQAYYLARSGAHAVAAHIIKKADSSTDAVMNTFLSNLITTGTSDAFKLDPADTGEIKVTVTKPSDTVILVSSTATVGSTTQTVAVDILVEKAAGEPFSKAVYSMGQMKLNGTVEGPVAGLSNVELGNSTDISGTVYFPSGAILSTPVNYDINKKLKGIPPISNDVDSFSYSPIDFPLFPTYQSPANKLGAINKEDWVGETIINKNGYYQDGISVSGLPLVIDKTGNRVIRTKSLNVSSWPGLKDTGTGSLTLIVDEEFSITGSVIFNLGNDDINIITNDFRITSPFIVNRAAGKTGKLNIYINRFFNNSDANPYTGYFEINKTDKPVEASKYVNIYYAGTKKLSFKNGSQLYGTLHIKTADLELNNGNGFVGDLFSGGKNILIDGGSHTDTKFIYAPAASVKITGGAEISGCIITNYFELENAKVIFKPVDFEPGDVSGGSSGKTTYKLGKWY